MVPFDYVFHTARYAPYVNISTSGAPALSLYAWSFNLSQCQGYGEYTALFDMYRINKIKWTINWRSSGISKIETINNTLTGMPILHYWVDYNDTVTPSALSDFYQVNNGTVVPFSTMKRSHTVVIVPKFQSRVYETGGTGYTTATDAKSAWCNMSDFAIDHYGLKTIIYTPGAAGSDYFDVLVEFDLSFAHQK